MAAVTSNEDDPRAKRVNNIKVYGTSARSSYFYLVELNEIHCHVSTQTSRSLETFSRCALNRIGILFCFERRYLDHA